MANNLNKFRKRNIQTNLPIFMLVIFVVAVSVCLITGLLINYLTLSGSMQKFYENSNLPSKILEVSAVSETDEEFLSSRFEYSKRYKFESAFQTGSGDYEGTFLVSDGTVSKPYLIEGEKERGCYVDYKFAEEHHFGINHSNVSFDYEVQGEIKRLEFKIVGFITLAEDMLDDGKCLIFIDEKYFLEELERNRQSAETAVKINYNQVLITSKVSSEQNQEIIEFYEGSSSVLLGAQNIEETHSIKKMENEIKTARNMLYIFPMIFVVISVLVIMSAINQLILKERYNIGLLRSIGISKKQIFVNYSGYGAFVCFFGAILGLLVSPLIAPNITFSAYDKIYNLPSDEIKLKFPMMVAVLIVTFSVLIGFLTALLSCLTLANKTPKECMSKLSNKSLKSRQKKKKCVAILSAPIRNMKLNLSRTIMSVVGICGCSLLMIVGFGTEKILLASAEKTGLLTMNAFSNVFKSFSIALMILTILILIMQIFKESKKEMCIRRIHGESYIKIWLMVLFEILFICLIGFVISVILSAPAMLLNSYIFGTGTHLFVDFLSYFKAFLILIFVASFISGFALIKIYRLNLTNAIKFSE